LVQEVTDDPERHDDLSVTDYLRRHGWNVPVAQYLEMAIENPKWAAYYLLFHGGAQYLDDVKSVMDCIRPSLWSPSESWRPPGEAIEWAQQIHRSRQFAQMAILADLLEENGCPDRPVLDHCRHDQDHFRGCVVLDWLRHDSARRVGQLSPGVVRCQLRRKPDQPLGPVNAELSRGELQPPE
jgi:hypothetical protein